MEAMMKKMYEMVELKRSNIFLKACNPSERIYNFDMGNLFMFYGAIMEKFGVKLLFTTFQ